MENLPTEIVRNFPLVLRMVSRKFRDDISIYDHWVTLNKQSIQLLVENRLSVRYIITDKTETYLYFPNIMEMKFYNKSYDHDGDQNNYTQNLEALLRFINKGKFPKLEKVYLNYCDSWRMPEVQLIKNVEFYVRNLHELSLNYTCGSLKYIYHLREDITDLRRRKVNLLREKLIYYESNNKKIVKFLKKNPESKISVFLIPGTADSFARFIKKHTVCWGVFSLDFRDYGCHTVQELSKKLRLKKSISKFEDLISRNIISISDHVDPDYTGFSYLPQRKPTAHLLAGSVDVFPVETIVESIPDLEDNNEWVEVYRGPVMEMAEYIDGDNF